jgi:hypothetical protein
VDFRTPQQIVEKGVMLPLGWSHPISYMLGDVIKQFVPGGNQSLARYTAAGECPLNRRPCLCAVGVFAGFLAAMLYSVLLTEVAGSIEDLHAVFHRAPPCTFTVA